MAKPKILTCTRCDKPKPASDFAVNSRATSGHKSACKACEASAQKVRDDKRMAAADAKAAAHLKAAHERLASDFDALKPEDFDVGVGNDGRIDPKAGAEKRQEYSRSMGEFANGLHAAAAGAARGEGDVLDLMPEASGGYIGKLAEQERRFGNRRLSRSLALQAAHEALAIRQFKQAAAQYLNDKITPTGYARKAPGNTAKRSVVLLLSDLHLGAELSSLDEPMPFRAVEEARRLEYVVRQALDYKPQYRDKSELVLLLNGDLIEGQLMHDFRDGAPLTEQKVVFWKYFRQILALAAQQYPSVRVVCQPGNHGRDLVRHPGRATSRKWDGHEFELYVALREMSSGLHNVTWQIDFRAVSAVDLHGSLLGLTHGDTEVKLGHPDTAAAKNGQSFDRINAARVYGVEFDAWAIGHFHTPRYHPRNPRVVYNGALVPPNGHARASGYIGEPCGQFIWEAVAGFPVGDLRFIEVGPAQDRDDKLGTLIQPFRFHDDA
jgi:hypothetical protein